MPQARFNLKDKTTDPAHVLLIYRVRGSRLADAVDLFHAEAIATARGWDFGASKRARVAGVYQNQRRRKCGGGE